MLPEPETLVVETVPFFFSFFLPTTATRSPGWRSDTEPVELTLMVVRAPVDTFTMVPVPSATQKSFPVTSPTVPATAVPKPANEKPPAPFVPEDLAPEAPNLRERRGEPAAEVDAALEPSTEKRVHRCRAQDDHPVGMGELCPVDELAGAQLLVLDARVGGLDALEARRGPRAPVVRGSDVSLHHAADSDLFDRRGAACPGCRRTADRSIALVPDP